MSTDVNIDEKVDTTTTEPGRFNVVFLNDDATPMEWVIELLKQIFRHPQSTAEKLMMKVHTEGSAVVGTYSFEIAEQKAHEAIDASRKNGFPLRARVEDE